MRVGTYSGRLLTVDEVAELLRVSPRHVYRLVDGGRMPRPLKLGGARRWDREAVNDWILSGCPAMPSAKRGGSSK
jgi:excisionase family DNA binding protein